MSVILMWLSSVTFTQVDNVFSRKREQNSKGLPENNPFSRFLRFYYVIMSLSNIYKILCFEF